LGRAAALVQRVLTAHIRFAAAKANLKTHMNLPAGQGAGMIPDLPGAVELLQRLVDETVDAASVAATDRIRSGLNGHASRVRPRRFKR
jgi:hypothetical protein